MEMEIESVFRYRRAVRCISITDISIALFMLIVFGLKISNPAMMDHSNLSRLLVIMGIHVVQFGMAIVLMTATYHNDTIMALSRCQKWYWTSLFLYLMLSMEFFVIFWYNGPYGTTLIKIIFRAVANHIVNKFMMDLRRHSLLFSSSPGNIGPLFPQSFGEHFGHPPPMPIHPDVTLPMYEEPPSYEESIKDKVVVEIGNGLDQNHTCSSNSNSINVENSSLTTTTTTNLAVARPIPVVPSSVMSESQP